MLNNLFESICVTSALTINEQLYFCSPPFIYIGENKHSLNAKMIYPLIDNNIALLTLDNQIKFLNLDLDILAKFLLPLKPLVIHTYGKFILIDYQQEYQTCNTEFLGHLQKKNKIVSFAPNPNHQITYVVKNKQLENNSVCCGKTMEIEMGVEQIYLISNNKPHYIYQSAVLPQLTIIDLETYTELYHIEFDYIIDQVFLFHNDFPIIQCENQIFQLKNQQIILFNKMSMRLSCVIEFNNSKHKFFGSINDNSLIMSSDAIIKEYYNLGQIVDIHPCNQICYIASYNKKFPVSLFRKGINEQIIERFKLPHDQLARKVFFVNSNLIGVSFTCTSELYNIPSFFVSTINIVRDQRTFFLTEFLPGILLQITINKILIISNLKGAFYEFKLMTKVIDFRYDEINRIIYLYLCSGELQQYQLSICQNGTIIDVQVSLTQVRTQTIKHLSAFQIINKQMHYCIWFQYSLHNYSNQNTYNVTNISGSIVSLEQTSDYILLALTDGNLVALTSDSYRFNKIFQISNTHPIKLIKYQNKVLIFSHHIYMVDNQLSQIIVNWDHLFDISYYNDRLVGIVSSEIQIVTLSTGSCSQCRELKFIKDIQVIGLRFLKDHLILASSTNKLFSYFDDQLKSTSQINFNIEKIEQYNNIYLAGYDDQDKGKIMIVNEILQQLYTFTYSEPIYDLMLHQNQTYFITNTAINNTDGTFAHDFKIPIKGFDIKEKYFLIYEQFKGAHLFYYDEKMIALGSLCYPCQYAAFYYEDIIGFSETEVRIAKQNLLTFMISEHLEVLVSNQIQITCVKDKYYGTLYGVLGQYE